ncbi:MAG: hypothetical protein U1G05_05155 [Kiritimatiellia bacterium]
MLAPSSSVVPVISEIWAEHRMYLPAPSCCSTWCWARRSSRSAAGGTAGPGGSSAPGSRSRFIQDGQDLLQNALYRNEIVMAAQREARAAEPPAHYNLGYALAYVERLPEAAAAFQRSIQCSTGRRLGPAGRGVLPHGRREPGDRVLLQGRGLRNNPSHPVDLANHLLADGRVDDCIAALRDGIRQYPGDEKLRMALLEVFTGNLAQARAELGAWRGLPSTDPSVQPPGRPQCRPRPRRNPPVQPLTPECPCSATSSSSGSNPASAPMKPPASTGA